jgi:hypothetical protein
MGNVIRMCTGRKKTRGEESDGCSKDKCKGKSKTKDKGDEEDGEKWETELLRKNLDESSFVTQAAILNLADGSLRARVPQDFSIDEKDVNAILGAFGSDGDSSQLTDHGLSIGETTYHPESNDPGAKVIVCSDGRQGGCILEKTTDRILVLVFQHDREDATKMATEIAKSIEDHGD